jgi:uncharacterized repeat protein (TIGR01451 family)
VDSAQVQAWHTTIADNRDGDGSGIFVTNQLAGPALVVLTNTILAGQTTGITVTAGNTAVLGATLWHDNGDNWGGDGAIMTGTLNFSGDPVFADRAGGDYHLGWTSAGIDKGLSAGVTTDIDGEVRPVGRGYDLGADEHSIPHTEEIWSISGYTVKQNEALLVHLENHAQTAGPYDIYLRSSNGLSYPICTGVNTDTQAQADVSCPITQMVPPGTYNLYSTHAGRAEPLALAPSLVAVGTAELPDLTISKSGPDEATFGQPITYTLTVTNSGTAPATRLVITDTIPDGAFYVNGGVRSGGVVSWTVLSLAANGASTQVTFVVTATQTITNSDYQVTATGGYSATGEVGVVTAITGEPVAGLRVINDSPTTVGQPTTLTATVTAGTGITYTWAFGDGASGRGAMVTHIYPAAGVYTAVVTAANQINFITGTTTVTIATKKYDDIFLPIIIK